MDIKLLGVFLFTLLLFSCSNDSKKELLAKELYLKNCVACHGPTGNKGLANAADLSASILSKKEQKHIVSEGKGMMAAFKMSLKSSEIDSIVEYIQGLRE